MWGSNCFPVVFCRSEPAPAESQISFVYIIRHIHPLALCCWRFFSTILFSLLLWNPNPSTQFPIIIMPTSPFCHCVCVSCRSLGWRYRWATKHLYKSCGCIDVSLLDTHCVDPKSNAIITWPSSRRHAVTHPHAFAGTSPRSPGSEQFNYAFTPSPSAVMNEDGVRNLL